MPDAGPDQLVREFVRHSPFTAKLGLAVETLEPDRCVLTLPFDDSLATYGDVVHGGATTTLADVAAMAAAWSAGAPARGGATLDLTVQFLRAARAEDLRAVARVIRRGRSICAIDVEVEGSGGDGLVAKALVTYKFVGGGDSAG